MYALYIEEAMYWNIVVNRVKLNENKNKEKKKANFHACDLKWVKQCGQT